MNYYRAKFARESKAKPAHWIIVPCGGWFRLAYIGGPQQ